MSHLNMRIACPAIVFLLGLFSTLQAQDYVPTKEDVNSFLNTTTLVVLDDNPLSGYNTRIREAVEQNWEITDFDFIEYSEFDDYRNDPAYSFLMTTEVFFDRDKLKARYRFLNLLLGGDAKRLNDMPDLCPVPLAYLNADQDNYLYKLDVFTRFIQNHVQLLLEDPTIASSGVFKYYNDNLLPGIKNKTLYVLKHELSPDVNTKEKIARHYPYDVEIVTEEKMDEAIRSHDQNIVFLHKVGPEGTRLKARCYKVIIGTGDANFYFFDHHMIKSPKKPDGLLESDFKRMARR